MTKRALCLALLALNLLYCLVLSLAKRPAAWSMFERVEPLDYSLWDRDGRPVDVRRHLMRSQYIVDGRQLASIVSFICRAQPGLGPLRFEERNSGVKTEVRAPGCQVPVPD